MNRIDGGAVSHQMVPSDLGSSRQMPAQTQTGTFKGEPVRVKDAASALADAAEEISMHNSDKVEKKNFKSRLLEPERPMALQQIEEIQAYLDASKNMADPKALAALAKRMQSGQENPRQLARQQSQDPALQFMLIQYALAEGVRSGAPAQGLDDLRDALADLEMESGPQIRAGLNSMGTAAEVAHTREDIATFQGTYRDVVLGDSSLPQTLKLVLNRLGGAEGEDLAQGINHMIKALGADLAAARPSTDSNRLHALVQDLYQLEVTATVMDGCRDLGRELKQKHGAQDFKPVVLMNDLINLTSEKWVTGARFTALASKLGVQTVGGEIALQSGNKALLRAMPSKIFPDAEVRQTLLVAVQEALDVAIDKEEG